jgi:hypothetical protein
MLLSNEAACLPQKGDILFQHDFCDDSKRKTLLNEIGQRQFVLGGFDRRVGTQKYNLQDDSACPRSLKQLATRIQGCDSGRLPATHVVVEQYTTTPWSYNGDYAPSHIVSRFESDNDLALKDNECWVARVPLHHVVHHINRPAEQNVSMWKLKTTEHHTNFLLKPGTLLVQRGEFLSGWRSYTTAFVAVDENSVDVDNATSIVLKFARLPESTVDTSTKKESDFGFVATEDDRAPRVGEIPPLKDLLTIIVTTSPIKSHPSTELLERTFETFRLAGDDFCGCEKVIVCDGFRHQQDTGEVSKKHSNAKQAMRNGIVTTEQASNYVAFKDKLQRLCAQSPVDSPFRNTRVEELDDRMGYGFALRHALRHCVKSPFVCVIQHDRTFMRPTPMTQVVETMYRHRTIKYVGISMRSNLTYRDIFYSKYGKHLQDEYENLVMRPPELLLDASKFGPKGDFRESMSTSVQSVKVMQSIRAYANAYQSSSQYSEQKQWTAANPPPTGKHQLTLSPTLFWYDNTHVCETSHYRDFVFDPKYKMVARGGFVEDKLSPILKRTVERLGLSEGHSRFGCFLLDDHSGYFFTGHLDGGAYVATDKRAALFKES